MVKSSSLRLKSPIFHGEAMASLSSEAIILAISPMRVSMPVATTTPCTAMADLDGLGRSRDEQMKVRVINLIDFNNGCNYIYI